MGSVKKRKQRITSDNLIKITKNGPYMVTGNIPLTHAVIETDEEGYPYIWRETEKYPQKSTHRLCRCGKSENKPHCDNHHLHTKFDGTETAKNDDFEANAKIYEGPELKLLDNKKLCVGAGFCTRAGNIWNLTTHSDTPEYEKIAIEEATNCPSGRLVLYDKDGNLLEPMLEESIAVTEDEDSIPGPLWVRGEIQIQSANKINYQKRNRVTLCRCGKSQNKPLCDGNHLDMEEVA